MTSAPFRPSPAFAIAIAALVIATGSVAWAAIPDTNGVIHSCYKVTNRGEIDGAARLRVIDPAGHGSNDSKACKADERALDWNQIHQVAGTVNADCSLQHDPRPQIVRSERISAGTCRLTFGADVFTGPPLLIVPPVKGENSFDSNDPTIEPPVRHPDGTWCIRYTLREPATVNFIATEVTR